MVTHGRQLCPHGGLVSSCRCAGHGETTTVVPCPWPEAHAEYAELKLRPGDQQLPVPNDGLDVQSQVIADIEKRRKLGIERYGTALQPNNGRDALRDAYEEAIDLAMYLKQAMLERDS